MCKIVFFVLVMVLVVGMVLVEEIKVGVLVGEYVEIMEQVVKVVEIKGLIIDIVEFIDYVVFNQVLNDGDLNVNSFQYQFYLDNQIKDCGFDLVSIGKIIIMLMGVYV